MPLNSPLNLPRIHVLMAVHNGSQWLKTQIDSIVNQKGVELKIFISVDYSTDDSFDVCKKLANCYNCISILPYGDRFGGAAQNFFRLIKDVSFDSCDYISFSDQDDIWFDSKLLNAVKAINKNKVDAYSGDVTAFWLDGSQMLVTKSQPQRRFDYIFESAGPGCTFVFNKKLASTFKEFLINAPAARKFILHDWLLYAFARSQGFKWFIDSHHNMLYRQHQNNQFGVNSSFSTLWKRFKLSLSGSVETYLDQLLMLLSHNAIDKIPLKMDFKAYLYFIIHWRHIRRRTRDRYFAVMVLAIMLILYFPTKLKKVLPFTGK